MTTTVRAERGDFTMTATVTHENEWFVETDSLPTGSMKCGLRCCMRRQRPDHLKTLSTAYRNQTSMRQGQLLNWATCLKAWKSYPTTHGRPCNWKKKIKAEWCSNHPNKYAIDTPNKGCYIGGNKNRCGGQHGPRLRIQTIYD